MESTLYGIFTRWFCIRNLTRSISDTSPTHVKIPYTRAFHEVISIYHRGKKNFLIKYSDNIMIYHYHRGKKNS